MVNAEPGNTMSDKDVVSPWWRGAGGARHAYDNARQMASEAVAAGRSWPKAAANGDRCGESIWSTVGPALNRHFEDGADWLSRTVP